MASDAFPKETVEFFDAPMERKLEADLVFN